MAITLGDAILTLSGNNQPLNRTLAQTEGQVKSWGQQVAGFFQSSFSFAVGGFIQAGITSIVSSLSAIPRAAFDAVRSNEALNQSFISLVASQMRVNDSTLSQAAAIQQAIPFAKQLRDWVQQLAILSPFDEEGVAMAMRTGLAYGFTTEEAQRLTKATIDMVTATGQGTATMKRIEEVLGRVNAAARVQLGDLTYLADAGVNVKLVMDRMGVSVADFQKGLINADDFIKAVIETLEDNFGGAAERSAETWAGLTNSLSDIVRIDLRTFFEGAFEALKPLALTMVEVFGSPDLKNSLREIGTTIGELITPAVEWLRQQLEALPAAFNSLVSFIRQLKDEMAGLTAGDIMAGLVPGVAQIQENLGTTLDVLKTQHEGTVENLKAQILEKGQELGEGMAKIADEYGPKIQEITERYAKSIEAMQERIRRTERDFNERRTEMQDDLTQRLSDMDERHNKQRTKNEEQLRQTVRQGEERITEIKADHARRRQQLMMNLLTAETEEQWLNIKAQLDAEDQKVNEQVNKTKDESSERAEEIRNRIAEEDAEYRKQRERTEEEGNKAIAKAQARHDEQMSDLRKALAEEEAERDKALAKINTQRAEEEKELQEQHDKEVAALQAKIDAEVAAYAERVQAAKDAAAAETQAFIDETNRRAAAIGTGAAHELAERIKEWTETFTTFKASVMEFVNNHGPLLTGVLVGLGVVLGGGAIISALTTIAGLLAAISWPIVAIVAGVALLYAAWTQNWFGIQQITAGVLLWLQTNIQLLLTNLTMWWQQHGAAVTYIVSSLWMVITGLTTAALGLLQLFWQQHGDFIIQVVTSFVTILTTLITGSLTVYIELFAAFFALLRGDWEAFWTHLTNAFQASWDTFKALLSEGLTLVKAWFNEAVESWKTIFEIDWGEIGRNIVDGIWGGLREKWGELTDWLGEQAGNLPDWINNPLGARSPAEKLKPTGASIIQGITAGAEAELAGLRQRLAEMMTTIIPGSLQPALAQIGPGGGPVQYNQYNQYPAMPGGFDMELVMQKNKEQTIDLLTKFYEE